VIESRHSQRRFLVGQMSYKQVNTSRFHLYPHLNGSLGVCRGDIPRVPNLPHFGWDLPHFGWDLFGFFAPRPQQALVLYTVLDGQYRAAKYRAGASNTLALRNPQEPPQLLGGMPTYFSTSLWAGQSALSAKKPEPERVPAPALFRLAVLSTDLRSESF
jgi:hypothetical protein